MFDLWCEYCSQICVKVTIDSFAQSPHETVIRHPNMREATVDRCFKNGQSSRSTICRAEDYRTFLSVSICAVFFAPRRQHHGLPGYNAAKVIMGDQFARQSNDTSHATIGGG